MLCCKIPLLAASSSGTLELLLLNARASVFSLCFTLCMLLTACASCIACAAALQAVLQPQYAAIVLIPKFASAAFLTPRCTQKERAQSNQVQRKHTIERVPSFTVTLCVRVADLTARPRVCTSQVSCQACRACVAG